jgi:Spy/CpxP family protein refolding chaperone
MKTLLKLSLLTAGLVAAFPLLQAADPAPAADSAAQHPRLRALMQRRTAIRHRIAERLGLSADQIAQLKTTRAKTAAAVRAVRADSSLTPEQKKAKVREAMQVARTEMRGVLTPEQQKQWRKMQQHLRARLGKG